MTHQPTSDPSANPPQPSVNPSPGPSSTPSAVPAMGNPQPINTTMMANTINDLVKSNLPSRVQIGEPDPFNGSDPKKLCTFHLQCKLNFQDGKDLFQDETTKVNHVLSYLKGSALDCFKPGLLDPIEPTWCSDFNLFSEELEANFSTFDPIGEAKAELEGLHMQENHQATKYFIKFMQLLSGVYWGEAALLWQAYNSLAKQIKNEMVHHEKPTTLSGLWKLKQAINAHYWKCKAEIACETPAVNSSGNKSERNNNDKCLWTRAKVLHSPSRTTTTTHLLVSHRIKAKPWNPRRCQLPTSL